MSWMTWRNAARMCAMSYVGWSRSLNRAIGTCVPSAITKVSRYPCWRYHARWVSLANIYRTRISQLMVLCCFFLLLLIDRDASVFLQIAQFCNHLVANHADPHVSELQKSVVTYLSGDNLHEKNRQQQNFSYTGILDSIPVRYAQIQSFYAKFKANKKWTGPSGAATVAGAKAAKATADQMQCELKRVRACSLCTTTNRHGVPKLTMAVDDGKTKPAIAAAASVVAVFSPKKNWNWNCYHQPEQDSASLACAAAALRICLLCLDQTKTKYQSKSFTFNSMATMMTTSQQMLSGQWQTHNHQQKFLREKNRKKKISINRTTFQDNDRHDLSGSRTEDLRGTVGRAEWRRPGRIDLLIGYLLDVPCRIQDFAFPVSGWTMDPKTLDLSCSCVSFSVLQTEFI